MQATKVLKKIDRIGELSTFPTIAIEVNRLLQNYDTSINQLRSVIEKDQAIVTKILQLVNSAFFGLRSHVGNIPHALILLGFNTVRNAVLSVSVLDVFSKTPVLDGFDVTEFWKHSIAVAITSKHLSCQSRTGVPDDCFIGGLLHDIGKVVLLQYFQDIFKTILMSVRENNLSFYEAEQREIPVNHAQIGGRLAKKWQLPAGLVDTIRFHHAYQTSANDPVQLMIVHSADVIVNNYNSDSARGEIRSRIHPEAAKHLTTQIETISDWFAEVADEIRSACLFFLEE